MQHPALAPRIGDRFAEILLEWLGAETMAKVRASNTGRRKIGDAYSCAAHDHCDANMPMAQAFKEIVGRDIEPADQADADLWNAAYEHATRHHLTDPPPS